MNGDTYKDVKATLPPSFVAGKIGIVTVTYNSESMLDDFLASVDRQSYRNFVLIAVDNASRDRTLTMLRERRSDGLILIDNSTNLGVAAANNQGIRAAIDAGCEYVLLLNNDVILDGELIARLVAGISETRCSMAVPTIYFHTPAKSIWAAGGAFRVMLGFSVYHRYAYREDSLETCQTKRIDYAPTCCVLIRREVFAEVGLMDERYFVYYDDVDFMFRARKLHTAMFLIPDAKLWHKVNGLTGGAESDFSYYYGARGRALFLYKHLGWVSASLWTILHAGFDLSRAVLRKSFRHACKVKWRGMSDGKKVALAA